jgi:hypothetical protein
MKLTQISVFLENRKGRLFEVCRLLGASAINIRALTIAESEGFGVLRIVVDKPNEAVLLLRNHQFVANLTDIVALQVPDKPGGLAAVLEVLNCEGINVEYMYGFLEKCTEQAVVVFRFDDTDRALKTLSARNIRVIGEQDMENL